MRNTKDGLSREDRLKRVASGKSFSVIDNDASSLLEQSLKVAGFLRYYNQLGQQEGYFDEFFNSFKDSGNLYSDRVGRLLADGQMEPSQALLLVFLENLRLTTEGFNERWKHYATWYLNTVLKVKPLPLQENKVWVSLTKKPLDTVVVKEGTRFITSNVNKRTLYYRLNEEVELLDTAIEKGYILNFEKDDKRIPETYFDFVTSIRVKELSVEQSKPDETRSLKTVGIKLTSPALLLREGERNVTITFYSQKSWNEIINPLIDVYTKLLPVKKEVLGQEELFQSIVGKFTENMFYLTISTTEGWEKIHHYSVAVKGDHALELKFTLSESFSSTTGCTIKKHKFSTKYPKLNIHLNFDAWLYPYSWMKDFMLYKVKIDTNVRRVNNVDVYNSLGQIDVAKPFPPFGINNEKGSWFAIGNYEMAVKNTKSIDIDIQWRQLPTDKNGLYGYYYDYRKNIDNTSFTLQSRFLANFNWKETLNKSSYYLFGSKGKYPGEQPIPDAPLADHTFLADIDVSKMPAIDINEDQYKYTLKSRSGFVDFMLQSPDMGFGEPEYRSLFTEQLMKSAGKDKSFPTINPPINPLIERITLNYKAEDTIDLTDDNASEDSAVDTIYPLDTLTTFTTTDKKAMPFAVNMEESNIMLALRNVVPGKLLNLYFDFVPSLEEIAENNIPQIQWYIGNMRNWKAMPHNFVQKDETRRLSVDGRMQFLLPEHIDTSLFDNEGLLWMRGGLVITETVVIPKLSGIYINAVPLTLDIDFNEADKIPFKQIITPLEPEKNIPGVTSFRQISSFYDGREAEDTADMIVRISEHITHQGKAVTPRDYERIVLQAFPDIAKAKCYRSHNHHDNSVYVAVLPFTTNSSIKPLVSNYVLVKIERYLRKLASGYVTNIKVTNPVYQEILVRAVLKFNGEYLSEARRKLLLQRINNLIAPWYTTGNVPEFNYSFRLQQLKGVIADEFRTEISITDFEVLRIEKINGKYNIQEYTDPNAVIAPQQSNIVFIPSKTHLIYISGIDTGINIDFGINEMELGDTFIIK